MGLHALGKGYGLGHSDLDGETYRAVDREAESHEDPAHPQSCAATDVFFPHGYPLDPTSLGYNWQLSSLHPPFTYRADCLWLPQSQSTPQLSPMCTLGPWPLFHGHH